MDGDAVFADTALPGRRRLASRLLAAAAAVATLAVVTACGGDPADPGAGPAASGSAGNPSALKVDADGFPVDQCALVPKSLVESTLKITVAEVVPSKLGCEFKTADFASGGGSYEFNVYPWDNGGENTYTDLADSVDHPDYRKVQGPWDEAVYYREFGGGLTFVFKTAKWGVSTSVGGLKLIDRTGLDQSPQMTTLASHLANALAG